MPKSTFVEILPKEQAQILTALRHARYGYLLALPIVLLCAAGRNPTEIAAVLFCSRSSVYRTVHAYRAGTLGLEHGDQGQLTPPVRTTVLVPTLPRSLLALLKATPHAYGWCRTYFGGRLCQWPMRVHRVPAQMCIAASTASLSCSGVGNACTLLGVLTTVDRKPPLSAHNLYFQLVPDW
jgi:hypothetical protein